MGAAVSGGALRDVVGSAFSLPGVTKCVPAVRLPGAAIFSSASICLQIASMSFLLGSSRPAITKVARSTMFGWTCTEYLPR